MKLRLLFLLSFLSATCFAQKNLAQGSWRAEIQLRDSVYLPFNFTYDQSVIVIHNADEEMDVDEIRYEGDSVFIQLPFFDTEIRALSTVESLNGFFLNHTRKDNNVFPFHAQNGLEYRFSENPIQPTADLFGRWQVIFDGEEGDNKKTIGSFHQEGNHLTGTFLTPTGDYRYLDGEVNGNKFSLSAFDGSHTFLFKGTIIDATHLRGEYWSGRHWHDTWTATKNDFATMADPKKITFLKPGYDHLEFSFRDENGMPVSLNDGIYKNKVVIVQLMGTWCPNCLDESRYLMQLHRKYNYKGLEIVALDYERISDTTRIWQSIARTKQRLEISYPVLYAGNSNHADAQKTLPMLNQIAGFPTTIVINKKGKVVRINTGFSGPATGDDYLDFMNEFEGFLQKLLSEN